MIKTFNKPVTKAIAQEIETALQGIAAKHGISIRNNGGSLIGDTKVVLKLALESCDIEAQRKDFARTAALYGLSGEDFHKVVSVNGRDLRLVGVELRRGKYPLKMEDLKNGGFVGLTTLSVPKIKAAAPPQ